MDYISVAKRIIGDEASALIDLAKHLNDGIDRAVNTIAESIGKVAVIGVGKSGLVGKKIASTMASLGKPAFFIHPCDAIHGDLGMFSVNDVILAISYSGESTELFPTIEFAKKNDIKIISITKMGNSSILRKSDISLTLPNIKEDSIFGLAPTVSSTMTLALGDALAVAVSIKIGFTTQKFKSLHPGGTIGNSLAMAFDIMHRNVPLISVDGDMQEAVIIMSEFGFGCVGVIDGDKRLIGIITDGDLRRRALNNIFNLKISEIMTKNPIIISSNMFASDVLNILESNKITNILIVNDCIPIGIIHIHDILCPRIRVE